MRVCLGLVLGVALLSGCAQSVPATWAWSIEDGCKPGIGLQLVVGQQATTGKFFILDPNKPHDFAAAGQAVELKNLKADTTTMTFDTTLLEGDGSITIHWTLKLERQLTGGVGAGVNGSLLSGEPSSSPMDILLVRIQ